ncbi:MAG: AzlC family ABC transporter permease [Propionibacteriaceae bacterium]|nr:AzlC family ABC transporter permease [Propionibacteriaceae bacterium]
MARVTDQIATAPHPGRRAEVFAGVGASLAAGLGLFPLGIAFGLLVVNSGLSWWVAPALSVAVFAGSMELLLVGLLVAVTPLATIALTTLLVNFRHVFYAFSFPLDVVRNPLARAYSVYALIDEAWAITNARPEGWTPWRLVSMQVALQSYWVAGGLVGVLAARLINAPIEGLDFALCALFITLALDAFRSRKQVPSVLLAGGSFVVALVLAPESALFTALLLFVSTLVVRHLLTRRRGAHA